MQIRILNCQEPNWSYRDLTEPHSRLRFTSGKKFPVTNH